ncbi:MAG TPA: hypothetical protein VJJ52_07315 [Candidatus Nanoarchaeia archaeon]|nr:hypothetical protein [Candidatus Nanoarchaeia archaeon]
MIGSLDSQTAKEFLVRSFKTAARGAGNVAAFAAAVPAGTFFWMEKDYLIHTKPMGRDYWIV